MQAMDGQIKRVQFARATARNSGWSMVETPNKGSGIAPLFPEESKLLTVIKVATEQMYADFND
jgi:hypothetical protein